jgi:cell division protein ZipA
MDKELLRIVIIATGLLVIVGMVLWSYLKARKQQDEFDNLQHEQVIGSSGNIDESLRIHHEHDEFDIIPIGSAQHGLGENVAADWEQEFNEDFDADEIEPEHRFSLPDIIQFGVIAQTDEGFNGDDLDSAFSSAGLKYGSLKIYERLNDLGQPVYGVTCMVEPGTFPEGEELGGFYCPGVVFYLQHLELEDAQAVFDDFIDTIKQVADTLDGEIWDHRRQPLTESTVRAIRLSL